MIMLKTRFVIVTCRIMTEEKSIWLKTRSLNTTFKRTWEQQGNKTYS